MAMMKLLLCYLIVSMACHLVFSFTDPQDATVLQSIKQQWKNLPPSWNNSNDPCGTPWEGVTCSNSRVKALALSSMRLSGELSDDIGGLTELTSLDLSFNPDLTGSVSSRLGDLRKLNVLILAGCGLSGTIPRELGNLAQLSFLALNSNNFTGEIPASLGNLTNLYWLDLSNNRLSGSIPVSTSTGPGLDLLKKAKHFHFSKNQLSGEIPASLFSSGMVLSHLLLDGNLLTGEIPLTLGNVQTLEILRLDNNALGGGVVNLQNLTNLIELNLASNNFSGPLPDLTGMNYLNYVNLSNNSFQPSQAPAWFSTLKSLTTLALENGPLQGQVPQQLFSLPQIQIVILRKNAFNDTLDMGNNISQQLQLVDLQNNDISSVTLSSGYSKTLLLMGNPVCASSIASTSYCQPQKRSATNCSTSLANCRNITCPSDQKLSPQTCACAYPYEGTIIFRAPRFMDTANCSRFHDLQISLEMKFGLAPGAVVLLNPHFNIDDYLQVGLGLFPTTRNFFNSSEIQRMGFELSSQTFKPPAEFGPYIFIAVPYKFPGQ
ncbi:leucine-rich repeat receptor protein kinase HPCA1-like [Coffea arabica]|uniref:non-specific serine/threonine protein kinase n=1 Tax=Coffea arabica TaxID=13443 RepID=A0A6P6SP89_COFAR|nr:probable leucine-rich repeat receptor-like protein kinase At5g49770 [Coffea arabica]